LTGGFGKEISPAKPDGAEETARHRLRETKLDGTLLRLVRRLYLVEDAGN
jgi:hypothetical protein